MRIICDMDSVMAECLPKWHRLANEEYGSNVRLEDVTDWDMSKFFPCGKSIYKYLNQPGFFRDLPVIPGAFEGLKAMQDAGHEIIVLSACASAIGKHDKTLWLNENFPFLKGCLLMNDIKVPKDAVRGDVLIDDGPHNVTAYREAYPGSFIVTFGYPYNIASWKHANLIAGDYRNMRAAWEVATNAVIDYGMVYSNDSRKEAQGKAN